MRFKKKIKKSLSLMLTLLLLMSLIPTAAFSSTSDVNNHWAKEQLNKWINQGLIIGYSDGTYKPNASITRAEFITLVNRAFKYSETSQSNFSDVQEGAWYSVEVDKANAAGYIAGYNDGSFKPNQAITRQEIAVILFRIMDLAKFADKSYVNKFSDVDLIPSWAKDEINSVVKKGYMVGLPDGSFQPTKDATRAEVVVTLDRAITSTSSGGGSSTVKYNSAGVYGPDAGTKTIKGNVIINADDVTLRNTIITGNLTLGSGIGDGDVNLQGVTVQGTTTVNGGGANSIRFEDCVLLTVIVNKNNGTVRVVAEGSTTVSEVQLESSAIVQNTGSEGFTNVTLNSSMPLNSNVELIGSFETVNTLASNVRITLSEVTDVNSLIISAIAQIMGTGTIRNATINSEATLSSLPTETLVIPPNSGGQVTIGDETFTEDNLPAITTTLTGISSTIASVSLELTDTVQGVTYTDFEVTANLGGEEFILEDLEYDAAHNRMTFKPVSYGENDANIGKEFVVTVTPKGDSQKVRGSSQQASLIVQKGFEGRITDIYGMGVEGLTINFREGVGSVTGETYTTTTGAFGYYSINLPPGMYTGELINEGFVTTYIIATSLSDHYNVGQNETAIRAAREDEVKVVLTWGENPADLDSHLVGPSPDGGNFHTWYGVKSFTYEDELYADLDWDDTESFGPETTTVFKKVDGNYDFYVHHFSGTNTLRTSGAKVEVYIGSVTEATYSFDVPDGDGSERYWDVFDLVIDGEEVSITPVNQMLETSPYVNVTPAPDYSEVEIFDNGDGTATFTAYISNDEGYYIENLTANDFMVSLRNNQNYVVGQTPTFTFENLGYGAYEITFAPGFAINELVDIVVGGVTIATGVEVVITEKVDTISLNPASGEATVEQGAYLVESQVTLSSNYNATGLKTVISLKKDNEAVSFDSIFETLELSTKVGENAEEGPYNIVGAYTSFEYGPQGGYNLTEGVAQVTTTGGKVRPDAAVGTYTITSEVKDGDSILASATYTLTVVAVVPVDPVDPVEPVATVTNYEELVDAAASTAITEIVIDGDITVPSKDPGSNWTINTWPKIIKINPGKTLTLAPNSAMDFHTIINDGSIIIQGSAFTGDKGYLQGGDILGSGMVSGTAGASIQVSSEAALRNALRFELEYIEIGIRAPLSIATDLDLTRANINVPTRRIHFRLTGVLTGATDGIKFKVYNGDLLSQHGNTNNFYYSDATTKIAESFWASETHTFIWDSSIQGWVSDIQSEVLN